MTFLNQFCGRALGCGRGVRCFRPPPVDVQQVSAGSASLLRQQQSASNFRVAFWATAGRETSPPWTRLTSFWRSDWAGFALRRVHWQALPPATDWWTLARSSHQARQSQQPGSCATAQQHVQGPIEAAFQGGRHRRRAAARLSRGCRALFPLLAAALTAGGCALNPPGARAASNHAVTFEYKADVNGNSLAGGSWLKAIIEEYPPTPLGTSDTFKITLIPKLPLGGFVSQVGFQVAGYNLFNPSNPNDPSNGNFAKGKPVDDWSGPLVNYAAYGFCATPSSPGYNCFDSSLESTGAPLTVNGQGNSNSQFNFIVLPGDNVNPPPNSGNPVNGAPSYQLNAGEEASYLVKLVNSTGPISGTAVSLFDKTISFAKIKNIGVAGTSLVIRAEGDPPNGNGATVPGPLPVLGAATAFGVSRRLRRRLKQPLGSSS